MCFGGFSLKDFLIRIKRNPSDFISFCAFHLALFGIFNMIMSEDAALWSRRNLLYHQTFAFFVTANILMSLWFLSLTDVTTKRFVYTENEHVTMGWDMCWRCEAYKPHRAYHCYQCRNCVLKRDHHCIFAVNCVGYANLRYFYTLLFWTWVGLIYANVVNYEFIVKVLMEFDGWAIFSFCAPLLAWLIGALHENFLNVILATVALGGAIYSSFLIKYHFKAFRTGVTCCEQNRLMFDYKKTWVENMREVFGANWPIAWISPVIPSRLDSDGTKYRRPGKSSHPRQI